MTFRIYVFSISSLCFLLSGVACILWKACHKVYLEITTAQKAKALEIIDNSSEEKNWKQDISKLTDLCK